MFKKYVSLADDNNDVAAINRVSFGKLLIDIREWGFGKAHDYNLGAELVILLHNVMSNIVDI